MITALNKLRNAFENVGHSFSRIKNALEKTADLFRKISETPTKQQNIDYTNYRCDSCNGILAIDSHDATEITYICLDCGKIHKSKKNQILKRTVIFGWIILTI